MYATVGTKFYPVESFAQVSAAYRAVIAELGLGASQTPSCKIYDKNGDHKATVSFNGRVWAANPGQDDVPPLYDPR